MRLARLFAVCLVTAVVGLLAAGCAGPETRPGYPNRFDLARPCDTPDGLYVPKEPSR